MYCWRRRGIVPFVDAAAWDCIHFCLWDAEKDSLQHWNLHHLELFYSLLQFNFHRNMGIWEYTLYFTTTTCLWSGKKPNGCLIMKYPWALLNYWLFSLLLYLSNFKSNCSIIIPAYFQCFNISAATVTSIKMDVLVWGLLVEDTGQNGNSG